jgi:hypothetical protein
MLISMVHGAKNDCSILFILCQQTNARKRFENQRSNKTFPSFKACRRMNFKTKLNNFIQTVTNQIHIPLCIIFPSKRLLGLINDNVAMYIYVAMEGV